VGEERGYTLIELLVTMLILTIVVGSLTTVFVSGSSAQVDLDRKFQAQQRARLALDRIRVDIHCATAAQAQTINSYPGVKLAVGNCFSSTPTISWCEVMVTSVPVRYQLYRTTTTGSTACTSGDSSRLLVSDYLTNSTAFTTSTIPQYSLQTVGVDFQVSVNPTTKTRQAYRLTDFIVTRNGTRCLTSGGCTAPSVP